MDVKARKATEETYREAIFFPVPWLLCVQDGYYLYC